MTEQDPMHDALTEVLRTLQADPTTAQAVGATCIKPGIDGTTSGSAAMCNEGETILGRKPENDCTTGAAMAQGAVPGETATGCVESGTGSGPTKAEEIGLDEKGIKQVLQSLLVARTNNDRRIVFLRAANRLGVTLEEVRRAVSEHKVSQIRDNEKGPLLHYHQTKTSNLDSILEQRGLVPYSEQKKRGISGGTTGSRPDVVQFTRDSYDKNGNLRQPGLIGGNAVGVDSGIAFVYNDDIMNSPAYDSTDTYPSATEAPFDNLHAVVVSDPNELETVAAKLAAKGVNAGVTTRDQWTIEHYGNAA